LAKEYFVENNTEAAIEKTASVSGTYNTAKAELKTETTEKIEKTVDANKHMTSAAITVSAGADLRLMNLVAAKALQKEKIAKLTSLKNDFTDLANQTAIDGIIAEISDTKKVESILDN